MMAFFWHGALVLILAAATSVNADVTVDCGSDYFSVVWKDTQSRADPSLLRLGNCRANRFTDQEAIFYAGFNECGSKRLVTGDQLVYMNDLIYTPHNAEIPAFVHPVVCAYERPQNWYPPILEHIVFHTHGVGNLLFHLELMNEDFSGPATSVAFPLGSFIRISARVEQKSHQPFLLFLEECAAALTPQLQHDSHTYPIITNKGCLVDSKVTRTKFEPRREASVINLSLQAFKFADGEEVYVHCKLVAWDPKSLDSSKKACHYVKGQGWELLDDPSYSRLCNCCESSCRPRKKRSTGTTAGIHGFSTKAVVGPFTITGRGA